MSEKKTFVQCADVETQIFDWGRLNWLSEPLVTAAEHFSCGVVEL
ncbi:MAG: cupin, partial [Gemmatimonadetes bacterium]|nr:cupin [Gemmatimonadota bacterium]